MLEYFGFWQRVPFSSIKHADVSSCKDLFPAQLHAKGATTTIPPFSKAPDLRLQSSPHARAASQVLPELQLDIFDVARSAQVRAAKKTRIVVRLTSSFTIRMQPAETSSFCEGQPLHDLSFK
eukprot:4952259-Pleurochrysis_carterae.AAC.1